MTDWLELPDPDEAVLDALLDEGSLPQVGAMPPAELPAAQGAVVAALRRLSWRQRLYLRAFLEGGATKRGAKRVMRDWGKAQHIPSDRTLATWPHVHAYAEALTLLKRHFSANAGLDRDSVIIKVGRVLEDALEPKPVYRDNSEGGRDVVTYTEEIDGNVAMRALEFAGKVNRMIGGDDASTRVTLNIVNIANRETPDVTSRVVSEQ